MCRLPLEVQACILYYLPLAHDIGLVGLACRTLRDAAKLALKARPFSGEVVTLAGHNAAVRTITVTSDGIVITASDGDDEDGDGEKWNVRFWRDGACVGMLRTSAQHGLLHAVAALPRGRFLCGHNDQVAHVREVSTGAIIHPGMIQPELFIWCVAAMPDGEHFVIGGQLPHDVLLYNDDGTLVHAFKGHSDVVNSVAATPDGQHIISGSDDKLVKVWSVANKSLVSTCAGHTLNVSAVVAMPDCQRILSGSWNGTIRVWLLDGTPENTFRPRTFNTVQALVALPDNQHALSATTHIKLFNVNSGAVLRTFANGEVVSMALLPDGLRFVSGHANGTVRIFETGLAPHRP